MKKYAVLLVTGFIIIELLCALFLMRSFLFPIKYQNLINQHSLKYNIEPYVIASVINVESGYDHQAKSKAGAIGLMQVLPSTANYINSVYDLNYKDPIDLSNPNTNIEIGTAYLKYLINKFNHLSTALASYNAGETVVRSWLNDERYSDDQKTLKNIPYKETKNYIKKINKNIKIYKKYKH